MLDDATVTHQSPLWNQQGISDSDSDSERTVYLCFGGTVPSLTHLHVNIYECGECLRTISRGATT